MTIDLSTEATTTIYAGIRARLLGFTDRAGLSLNDPDKFGAAPDAGQARLYVVQAPDDAMWPHGTMRLSTQSGQYEQELLALLELQFYGKPRAAQPLIETMMDLAQAAMTQWRPKTDGLLYTRGTTRASLPFDSAPARRETCGVRALVRLKIWPRFLTRVTEDQGGTLAG